MAESSIDDLKTDARIGDILKKLQLANNKINNKAKSQTQSSRDEDLASTSQQVNDNSDTESGESDNNTKEDINNSLVSTTVESDVASTPNVELTVNSEEDSKIHETLVENNFVDETILPWFTDSDRDTSKIHYIELNDSGNLEYCSIDANKSSSDIATLKLKRNYLCDIDYYKSRHYVLCVKVLDSNYSYTKRFTNNTNESKSIITPCSNNDSYSTYIVYTDLGTIEFVAKHDDIVYPFNSVELNKWLEEVSNDVIVKDAKYEPNSDLHMSDIVRNLDSTKYDLITMHRPGVITLDSVDDDDCSVIHIKLKEEYDFLPMNRILGCLKNFSTSDDKSFGEFKRFINKYFNVVA